MKEKLRLSGSIFSIAQKCPASLTIPFSKKLMSDGKEAADGTDEHEKIANDIESMRRFLPDFKDTFEHIERQRELEYKDFNLSGGIDYYALSYEHETLYVVDWKTGPMGIDHLGPAQIEFYAFIILKTLAKIELKRIKKVELSLVSPRLNQKKTFTRTPQEILALTDKFDLILEAIKKKQKPIPGEHCRYCNKRFVCTEFKEELKKFAGMTGKKGGLTAEDLRTLSIAEAAIKDIKNYVKELLENGHPIPGVRMETQNAARVFAEGVDALMISEASGIEHSQLFSEKLKTPSQLEKEGFDLSPVQEFIVTTTRKVLKVESPDNKGSRKIIKKIKVKR